jgi:hypothetical protein
MEKEIAEKLYGIQDLELKEMQLKDKLKKLSKRISKYKDVVPLIENYCQKIQCIIQHSHL